MAILYKKGIPISAEKSRIITPIVSNEEKDLYAAEQTENGNAENEGLRGAICVPVDNFLLLNVHLPSGRPAFARKIFYEILNNIGGFPNMIFVGDFNTTPSSWTSLQSKHLNVVNSNRGTHLGGHELDYAITNITGLNVINERNGFSDHNVVIFNY